MEAAVITAVGIDVSKSKSTVAVRRPGGEIVLRPFEIHHTNSDLKKLASTLKKLGGDIRIVMEHTSTYWRPIALTLKEAGFFVSVVNAMLIHDFSDNTIRKLKTDRADAVAAAREKAISYEDFQDILQDEYDVFVKTQRGRYSYLPPERNKFISESSLGESCKRECLEGFFVQNAEKNLRYKEEPILIFTTRTRLRLVVDLQENVRAQENLAYALKVKISNLQKMAETLVWVQENNINDLTELNDLCKTAQANAQAAYEQLSQAEDELYKINEQIHYAGQYLSTKEVQQQFTKAILKKKFRAEHSKELDAYAESVKYFREENDGKLPSLKSLKKRKEELTQEIAERKKVYTPLWEESRCLEIASDNVYSIFRKTNEMKSDLAWKREWEAKVREKARQEQARQEQRERQPKRKKRSYDMSL